MALSLLIAVADAGRIDAGMPKMGEPPVTIYSSSPLPRRRRIARWQTRAFVGLPGPSGAVCIDEEPERSSIPVGRGAPRRLTAAPSTLASSSHGHVACEVSNLSRVGARVRIGCRLRCREHVLLTFAGMAPLLTRVAWAVEGSCGLEFVDALHPAVLNRLLLLYPPDPRASGDAPST